MTTMDSRAASAMLLSVFLAAAAPSSAAAATDTADRDASEIPEWSFGVGVTLSGGPIFIASPRGHVERRIGPRTALVLALGGAYDSTRITDPDFDLGAGDLSTDLGLRWLWTHAGPIRVSVTTSLRLAYGWREAVLADYPGPTYRKGFRRTREATLGSGVAFDLPLIEGLTLRMASNLLRGGVQDAEGDAGGSLYGLDAVESGWWARLTFEPSIELRMEL